jgi:hypothetical protein
MEISMEISMVSTTVWKSPQHGNHQPARHEQTRRGDDQQNHADREANPKE